MSRHTKETSRITPSVATTLAMIAPTKNPSSRLKMAPQSEQIFLIWKGRPTTEARPQTGQRSINERFSVRAIGRGSGFIEESADFAEECQYHPCQRMGSGIRRRVFDPPADAGGTDPYCWLPTVLHSPSAAYLNSRKRYRCWSRMFFATTPCRSSFHTAY